MNATRTMKSVMHWKGICAMTLAIAAGASVGYADDTAVAKPATDALPKAKEVIAKSIEARGGEETIRNVQHRTTKMQMAMPSANMTFTMTMHQSAPSKSLAVMEIPGMGSTRTGYNGEVGWTMDDMQGPRLLEGAELAMTIWSGDLHEPLHTDKYYKSVETVGKTTFEGKECFNLRYTTHEGQEMSVFYDAETYLPAGMRIKVPSPMGEIDSAMITTDYRDFDGVKIATKMINRMEGLGMEMTATVQDITHDPIDESTYALPRPIAELARQRRESEADASEAPDTERSNAAPAGG